MRSAILRWSWCALGLPAVCAILSLSLRHERVVAAPNGGPAVAARPRCGTPHVTDRKTLESLRQAIAGARNAAASKVNAPIMISVQFIHITDGSLGQITAQQRQDQIDVLNAAFEEWGIQFSYTRPPKVVNNPLWFNMPMNSEIELEAKTALQENPTRYLNLYTCNADGGNLLGWSTFPWQLAVQPELDGVVVHCQSLPGGAIPDYDLGQTATHEIGHWLGLFHTFQGGCDGVGDQVDDTVAHAHENFGCPAPGPNGACNAGEEAPIHNFMNYIDDACMTEFTPGQSTRMHCLTGLFRPKIGSCDCVLDCLATVLSNDDWLPLEWLPQLRAMRDNLLNKSADGRRLARLYYQHSPELFRIMATDRELARRSLKALHAAMPSDLVESGEVAMPVELYDECLVLLERLETKASRELTDALADVRVILGRRIEVADGVAVLRFPADKPQVAKAARP